ncbi:uncharacterized protein F4817DRAFT_320591 [Daldinia loculata]|uniref:uncharacterized protein n=1 Tax=Daldinia loculata TaxID=103429 RepID=UPI0020C34DFC|nr:uncharacterized protein F4817DRAFT_320591 [Daldinia loculata]KAI1642655.1 hypothetical protein F4817DRAFT_320591 [Daldinia loculata]
MASNKKPFSFQEAIEVIEKKASRKGLEQHLCSQLHAVTMALAQRPKSFYLANFHCLLCRMIWTNCFADEKYPWSEDSLVNFIATSNLRERVDPKAMRAAADAARIDQNLKLALEIIRTNKVPQSVNPKLVLGEGSKRAHEKFTKPPTKSPTNKNNLRSEIRSLVVDVHGVRATPVSQPAQIEGILSRLTAIEQRLGMGSGSLKSL